MTNNKKEVNQESSTEVQTIAKHFSLVNHVFDTGLAEKYGISEAIIIQHFQFWINNNARLGKNWIEGRSWSFQTIEEIAAHYPYLSIPQVKRIIHNLVKQNILIKNNFNKSAYDRTVWYAFNNEEMFRIGRNRKMDSPNPSNGSDEIVPPIPDTLTDSLKDPIQTPPTPASGEAAIAAEEGLIPKKASEFSKEVKDLVLEVVNVLKEANSDYRQPKDPKPLLTQCHLLVDEDKREPNRVLEVLRWAVKDTELRGTFKGWSKIMYGKNGLASLRKNFASIAKEMQSREKRKFAPSSNDERSLEKYKEWSKTSL